MIKLKTLLLETLKGKDDFVGGIVQGEVRAERVPTNQSKYYPHRLFPGLSSADLVTNWRYEKGQNAVIWSILPNKSVRQSVDDYLFKRGVENPIHKTIYSDIKESVNDTDEWHYWWMDPNLRFHPVEHEGHAGFALKYLSRKGLGPRSLGYRGHYEEMYQLGWIRLGLAPYQGKYILGYNYSPSKPPTDRQKRAINSFAKEIEADEIRDNTAGKWEFIDQE